LRSINFAITLREYITSFVRIPSLFKHGRLCDIYIIFQPWSYETRVSFNKRENQYKWTNFRNKKTQAEN